MSEPIRWRPIVVQAGLMWLATRLAFVIVTYATVILNGYGNTRVPPGFIAGEWNLQTLIGVWQRWDAGWYVAIAQRGYFSEQSTAFFPLYPALIHLLSSLTGSRLVIVDALLISNLAALAGFVGVALLAVQEGGPAAASSTLRALAAYPLAFFLAAPYSESLLLAAAGFTLFLARRGAWWWTALAAFVAALSRPTAGILLLALGWEFGRQHGWWSKAAWSGWSLRRLDNWRSWLQGLVALSALPFGLAIYAVYLWRRFGHPLLFLQEQAQLWNHRFEPPWLAFRHGAAQLLRVPVGTYWTVLLWMDVGALLGFALLTIIGIRRQPLSFTLYVAGLIVALLLAPILVLPDPFVSAARYLLMAIPVFLLVAAGMRRWPQLDLLVVAAGFMLQTALLTYFLSGGWVA